MAQRCSGSMAKHLNGKGLIGKKFLYAFAPLRLCAAEPLCLCVFAPLRR